MTIIESIFQRRSVNEQKLKEFGFQKSNDIYTYQTILPETNFLLTVTVSKQGEVETLLIDQTSNEPYILHLIDGSSGDFIGFVRSKYEEVLTEIATNCFEKNIFMTSQAKEIISYVQTKYGDELEYLWQKFPDNAIWRNKETKKWYAALLKVQKSKLGIKSDETVEVLNLRIQPEKMSFLIDNKSYFPGWHMNKKNWFTVVLDNSIETKVLYQQIDDSYQLS